MIQRGDRVLNLAYEMEGTVRDLMDGDLQIAWDPGHENEFSGGTYWGGAMLLAAGLIEVVGGNGSEAKVPDSLINPIGRDLFAESDQMLLFEM